MVSDEIEALQAEVDLLTNDGINKIIVLGTSGLEKETEIALNIANVDVIVGADHHQFLYTGNTMPTGNFLLPWTGMILCSEANAP